MEMLRQSFGVEVFWRLELFRVRYQPTEKNYSITFQPTNLAFLFVQIQLPQEGSRSLTNVEHVGAYYAQIREGIILRNIFCVSAASQFRERRRRGGEKRERIKKIIHLKSEFWDFEG